ncbi:MAG TPA: hypothetical protein VH186_23690 [Chloroflexia bacterium]|nr:hypothetical protein [Chloroflexia bacterium]
MPEKINPTDILRARMREDLRQVLFDGMKKAEKSGNWEVFNRYAELYMQLSY